MTVVEVDFNIYPIFHAFRKGKFRRHLARELIVAGRRVGRDIKKLLVAQIRSNMPPPNSPFTNSLKPRRKTLQSRHNLPKAIKTKVSGSVLDLTISVGVHRDHPMAPVAKITHDGAKIVVTAKMERFFHLLFMASISPRITVSSVRGQELLSRARGIIAPLKQGTQLIIPPRPWARTVYNRAQTQQMVEKHFRKGFENAWKRSLKD